MAEGADVYDPDDVGLGNNSPRLEALKINLTPSPSPPPAPPPSQANPGSSPGRRRCKDSSRQQNLPRQDDAVLFSFMGGGRQPDFARLDELTTLAANAMMVQVTQSALLSEQATLINKTNTPESNVHAKDGEPTEVCKQVSPDTTIKTEIKTLKSELPPILSQSSQSNPKVTLPSISDQLGDINHLTEPAANSLLAQSLPEQPGSSPFSAISGQESPQTPPHDSSRLQLPFPIQGAPSSFYPNSSSIRRPSQTDGGQDSNADYCNTATPTTDQPTIPQNNGFKCTYPGCTAQPFLTPYLLTSHANVHSSNRPHYCSIKGCPRSEGGKGFKRKNEMIKHGFVHDSPGYACPFCLDKKRKYPRPDNLSRHVKVHHENKDKDDPQLREVLSKKSEGQSRGRRRRGGTS